MSDIEIEKKKNEKIDEKKKFMVHPISQLSYVYCTI